MTRMAKTELSSLDVKYIVEELQFLEGARVQKFFQNGKDLQIVMHVSGKGTQQLIAGPGKLYITKYSLEHPEKPTNFAMYLRKHLAGQRLQKVEQVGFERIVILHFPEHKLYLELFGGGNCIVTTENNRIWSVMEKQFWKDRAIKQMELYELPPQKVDLLTLKEAEFTQKLKDSDKKIVVFLASELSLGGIYAEELLTRVKLDKNKKASELPTKEIHGLFIELTKLLEDTKKPSIIFENGQMIDVVPVVMQSYGANETKEFETFSSAVDEYFTQGEQKTERKEKADKAAPVDKNLKKLQVRLEHQLKSIEELKAEEILERKRADLIYLHYQDLQKLLGKAKEDVDSLKMLSKVTVKKKDRALAVKLEEELELYYEKSLDENAGLYYDRAKKIKLKIEGAEEAMKETQRLLDVYQKDADEKTAQEATKKKRRLKKEWFEKFKWFYTSGKKLVIAGRDAGTNEMVLKKHTDSGDVVFHTDMAGSPFTVVKMDKGELAKEEIQEVATYCASQSRAWSLGYGSAETYYVKPDQISKEARAGEFLTKGAFVVHGERHYLKPEMEVAVGALEDGKIMCGPVAAVEANCGKGYLVLKPGETKKSDVAKSVKKFLEKQTEYEISLDDIMQSMPPGDARIVKK